MHTNSERAVFKKIMACTEEELKDIFTVSDEGSFYRFTKKDYAEYHITVEKDRQEGFWVPVNADFGFDRPAGSNNYRELLDVGRHLVCSFGLTINW